MKNKRASDDPSSPSVTVPRQGSLRETPTTPFNLYLSSASRLVSLGPNPCHSPHRSTADEWRVLERTPTLGRFTSGQSPPDTQQCPRSCQRFSDVRKVTTRSLSRLVLSDAVRILHSSRASSRPFLPLSLHPLPSSQKTLRKKAKKGIRPGSSVC